MNSNRIVACSLASGSKGNAIYLADNFTAVLFDAGLSGIQIQKRLEARGIRPERINAIIVSHEHSDHVRGVGVLSRRLKIPVYISRDTHLAAQKQIGALKQMVYFRCGESFTLNTLKIHPFSISHDAADPAAFTVESGENKIGIATDLGIATSLVKTHLKGCRMLFLEANHDMQMLIDGPYPWELKQRIKSRSGHLSNEDSRNLLQELIHDGLTHVILSHLSEENNTPRLALKAVGKVLAPDSIQVFVASQNNGSELICIE